MTDASSLSNSELDALLRDRGLSSDPADGFDSFLKGVREAPTTITDIPRGLYQLGGDVLSTATGQADEEQAIRALRGTGTIAAGTAGGLSGAAAGAAAGSVFGPIGTVVGGGIGALGGGAIASRGYEYLIDLIRGGDAPTAQKVINDLAYDAGSGGVIDLATFGLGRGARTSLRFLDDAKDIQRLGSKAGKEAKAARALRKIGIDEDTLARVDAEDARSIGEQLQDPDIGRVETALDKEYRESVGTQASEQRAARREGREGLLVSDPDITKQDAGAAAHESLSEAKEIKSREVSKAYDAVPGETRLNISPVLDKIEGILDRHLGEGSFEKLSPEVDAIVRDLIDNADDITVARLKNYRTTLGNELSFDKPGGINKALAGDIREAIDDAAQGANTGLAEAVTARREKGQLFEEGAVGKILKKKGYGERATLDSQVVGKVLKNPESAAQFAAVADDAGKQAISDFVIKDIKTKVEGGKLASASAFYRNKLSELESILTPEQFSDVSTAIRDIDSQLQYERLTKEASRSASPTAQFTADQAGLKKLLGADATFIDKHPILTKGGGALIGYMVGPGIIPVGGTFFGTMIGAGVAEKAASMLKNADTEIAGILYQALTDKAVATELLSKAATGDTFAQGLIKQMDAVVEKAADLAGVEDLASALAIPTQTVGEYGTEDREGKERFNRVQEKANALSEMDDAQFLNLMRSRGLDGSSKKKGKIMEDSSTPLPQTVTDEILDAVKWVESKNGKYQESPVGAKGPYQLMDATGERIHGWMDIKEPYDPYNEAQARSIAKYHLEDGLRRFGTMELALADYNLGNPGMQSAIKSAGSKVFSEMTQYLPNETAAYVPKVIEALLKKKG